MNQINQLLNLLNKYNRRDQTLILGCGLAVAIYLLWLLILVPIQNKRDQLLAANTASTHTLGRVQIAAAQIQQFRDAGASASSENIGSLIDSTLRANGLAMTLIQPGSNGDARVRLD